ncbi:MAG: HEPN domain-containing protein [Planctomycetota bacterium]
MTWAQLGRDNYAAAQLLLEAGQLRSSISRAYYAVYSVITHYFSSTRNVDFAYGGNNPSHAQMLALALNNLDTKTLSEAVRRDLRSQVRGMQRRRVIADYAPTHTVDKQDARDQVRSAKYVLRSLGVDQ